MLLSFINCASTEDDTDWYNILSFDGGGIRGVITSETVNYMELYAYDYAVSKGYDKSECFPKYVNETTGEPMQRMHMTDLFEMMAGTSTGSILSAAMSIRNSTTG